MIHRPFRGQDIRERNEKIVLYLIYKSKGISQSEVSLSTGLKPPTVLRIFSNLEQKELIKICSAQKDITDKKGRKPVFYCVNPKAFFIIGLNFWAKSVSIVIVDFRHDVVYENSANFKKETDAIEVTDKLIQLIEESLKKLRIPRKKLLGIGIGSPGKIDMDKGRIMYYSEIDNMNDFNLGDIIEKKFGIPVYISNNCSVMALSEYRYGESKGCDSLLAILIRTGVGGAFISGGKIFDNQNKTALELGHMSIDINGRPCTCGAKGCLEAYLSEESIISDVDKCIPVESIDAIENHLLQHEALVVSEIEEKGRILALGIRNLFQLFNPQVFIILSRSKVMSEIFARIANDMIEKDQYISERNSIKIIAGEYKKICSGLGATDLVFDRFFSH